MKAPLSTFEYWDRRYRSGRSSGDTNDGPEGAWKVAAINALLEQYGIKSVLDLGCGDGVMAAQLHVPMYVGYDPSPSAIRRCRTRVLERPFITSLPVGTFDATLSLDVIYHLVEYAEYRRYLTRLFDMARRLVIVYGTNHEAVGPPHVRHRAWLGDVPDGWTMRAIDCPYKHLWTFTRSPS